MKKQYFLLICSMVMHISHGMENPNYTNSAKKSKINEVRKNGVKPTIRIKKGQKTLSRTYAYGKDRFFSLKKLAQQEKARSAQEAN